MPYYISYNNEIVTIVGREYRKQSGKGTNTQCYYTMSDGKQKHASFFTKLTNEQITILGRDVKIEQLINDN